MDDPASSNSLTAVWLPDRQAQCSAWLEWNLSTIVSLALKVRSKRVGSGLKIEQENSY